MNGPEKFVAELVELGYDSPCQEGEFVSFSYTVEIGPMVGEEIELGFKIPPDYDLSPPGGLLVRPHLLPMNGGGEHPWGGIHPSSSGGIDDISWQYWSRPYSDWSTSSRNAAALIGHVRQLFATLDPTTPRPHVAA